MKTCGLRKAYAAGGLLDDLNKRMGYSGDLMKDFNNRMNPVVNKPTAMGLQADREAIEDSANQAKMDQLKSQADNITGIGSSGLSQRQKAAALSQLQGEAGKMGMSMDTGISGMSGLSSRQGLSAGMSTLSANNAAADFTKTRNLQRLSASYADKVNDQMGFKDGGKVGVDHRGFIDGPGGVDNVPARVAETGEEIRVGAGERIVNKDQNAALEKLAGAHGMDLDDYLESATGEPVGPTMKKGLRAAQFGWNDVVDGAKQAWAGAQNAYNNLGATKTPPPGYNPNVSYQGGAIGGAPAQAAASQAPAAGGQTVSNAAGNVLRGAGSVAKGAYDLVKKPLAAAGAFLNPAEAAVQAGDDLGNVWANDHLGTADKLAASAEALGNTAGGYLIGKAKMLPGLAAGYATDSMLMKPEDYRPITNLARKVGLDTSLGRALDDRKAQEQAVSGAVTQQKPATTTAKNTVQSAPGDKSYDERFDDTDRRTKEQRDAVPVWDAKSMEWMNGQGVNVAGLRRNVMDDVNRINGNGPEKVGQGELRQVNTANGRVYAARDKNGQLVVTSGLDRSPEEQAAATKSGYEQAVAQAAKDKATLRQMERDRYIRDTGADITDPNVQRNAAFQLARMNQEDAASEQAKQHAAELGLRQGMLDLHGKQLSQQDDHFKQTLQLQKELAAAKTKETGIQNMDKMFEMSGLKGDRANNFRQFVYQNHADALSALPHEQQLKVLPRLIADFEDAEQRNANSTNGTSWQNQKRASVDKLDYEKDSAVDPNGILDKSVWFGSGTDGKGLGKANIFLAKNFPDWFPGSGSDSVDVMPDGQRVRSRDNRGARGMLGSRQMREINRLSLRDGDK